MLYFATDHLGGVDVVTNGGAAVVARLSHSAHGARRNGATWIGAPTSAEWLDIANTTRRGFTGHEHLDNISLVHMNGRVFDPRLGRFLSADPYIDGAASTQGWNRYSYVRNGLLNAIDPSGFVCWSPDGCDKGALFTGAPRAYIYGSRIPEREPNRIKDWVAALPEPGVYSGEATFSTLDGTRYSVTWEPFPEEPLRGGFLDLLRTTFQWIEQSTAPADLRCGVNANCFTFPLWGTPRGGALPAGSLAASSASGLEDLAAFRSQLGLQAGEGALARLAISGRSFYGINAHGQQVNLRVNAITRTHAEADAFQQAANASMRGGSATLYVDRALCVACGTNGGVVGMARQLGVTELTVVTPQGIQIVRIGL